MELPQSRPFGTESKKPTHDFLTMYSDSPLQHQDPRASSQGIYPKTRDFLHPLERVSKSNGIIREAIPVSGNVENPSSVEHLLPGGIGTYTISHVTNLERGTARPERSTSVVVQASNTERKIEPKRSNNGSSSSYNGGAFTLWDETMEKEKIVMNEKMGGQLTREPADKLGQWSSESPSSFIARNGATSGGFSSISSSKQKQGGGHQKNQGFMEMMKSIKGLQDEEDDDEEEYMKREGSSQKGDMGGKVEGKGNDLRANTPRSKHSATEQRRRSKINDRFQILRELIPHSDQKRDKASFLLEVIEYIHFLQEKVTKYETAFPGWNQDSMKLMPWKHSQGSGECITDHARVMKNGPGTGLMFPGKFDESSIPLSPAMLAATQNPMEPDHFGGGPIYKPMDHHHPALTSKGVSLPMQHQQNTYPSAVVRGNAGFAQPQRLLSDAENLAPQWQRPCPTGSDTLTEQEELTIEGGTVRMSSVYSHGLLSSLTHALQSSGIDLSQASVSVQIDLGKRAIRPSTTTSSAKDHEDPSSSTRAMAHSRVASSGEDSDPAQKRLRMDNS